MPNQTNNKPVFCSIFNDHNQQTNKASCNRIPIIGAILTIGGVAAMVAFWLRIPNSQAALNNNLKRIQKEKINHKQKMQSQINDQKHTWEEYATEALQHMDSSKQTVDHNTKILNQKRATYEKTINSGVEKTLKLLAQKNAETLVNRAKHLNKQVIALQAKCANESHTSNISTNAYIQHIRSCQEKFTIKHTNLLAAYHWALRNAK